MAKARKRGCVFAQSPKRGLILRKAFQTGQSRSLSLPKAQSLAAGAGGVLYCGAPGGYLAFDESATGALRILRRQGRTNASGRGESIMSEIIISTPRAAVRQIRLNRPARRNALGFAIRAEIAAAITEAAADPDVRIIVLTGDAVAFAAGGDLSELADAQPLDATFAKLSVTKRALEACRKPVIAAVNGFALGGGCELALMCDMVVAGSGAQFGLPEVKVGVIPGAGGTQRFLQAAGKAKALRYMLTGDLFTATEAAEMGLVSEVVADDQVLNHALDLAEKIARQPPLAVTALKEAVRLGANAPLETAVMIENHLFQLLFSTADQKEGMQAFLEKRRAQFTGR